MPTRFYTQDPNVSGPLDFLAGFGIQRQNVKSQEAELQQRQDIADSASFQGGMGALTNVFGAKADRTQQTSMEQLRQVGQLANIAARGQQNRHNAALDNLVQVQGETPGGLQGPTGGVATASPPAGRMGPPASANIGQLPQNLSPQQQAQPPIPRVPAPVNEPAMVSAYRKAEQRLPILIAQGMVAETDPGLSPEDRAQQLATLTPEIAALQNFMNRNPRPKPPRTQQELIQQGLVIPIEGSSSMWAKGKDGYKPATLHPDSKPSWMKIPPGPARQQAKQESWEATHYTDDNGDLHTFDGEKWQQEKQPAGASGMSEAQIQGMAQRLWSAANKPGTYDKLLGKPEKDPETIASEIGTIANELRTQFGLPAQGGGGAVGGGGDSPYQWFTQGGGILEQAQTGAMPLPQAQAAAAKWFKDTKKRYPDGLPANFANRDQAIELILRMRKLAVEGDRAIGAGTLDEPND
jgi:hypothetical protein